VPDPAACAPFWAGADGTSSSLQITAVIVATAARVAVHDPAVAGHPWLARATAFCLDAIAAPGDAPHAMELAFAVQFLDVVAATQPRAVQLVNALGRHIPPDGLLHVTGGADDEFMRPLDFTPFPGGPARALFDPAVVDAEFDRLAGSQQPDGGWAVDFDSYSPAATLEWRGHRTVQALSVLRSNGRL
jgi:hypothetical protein